MKTILLSSLLIFSLNAFSAEIPPRSISTTGEASVKVVPDEVDLTFGIETANKDLDAAKTENDKRAKDVMKLAKDFGIDAGQIQTDHLSIEPRYESHNNRQVFVEYVVRNTIVITLKDISKFENLVSTALKAGVNYVHGIDFRTTELRKHRDKARSMAIQASKEKAMALAKELGQTIGKPLLISEYGGRWSSYRGWGSNRSVQMQQNVVAEGGGGDSESSLAPGKISVTASVTVSFELEDPKK